MVFHSLLVCGDNLHYEKFADGRVKCIEDEIPFDLPDGWAWSRIKNISLIGTGATPLKSNSTYYKDGTIPWITSAATSKASITLPTDYITSVLRKIALSQVLLKCFGCPHKKAPPNNIFAKLSHQYYRGNM